MRQPARATPEPSAEALALAFAAPEGAAPPLTASSIGGGGHVYASAGGCERDISCGTPTRAP